MSLTKRFTYVFSAPAKLFAELQAQPGSGWWFPLLIVSVLFTAVNLSFLGRIDWATLIENQIAEGGQKVPPDAMEKAVDIGTSIGKFQTVAGGVIGPIIMYLVMALIFWLLVNLCKRPISYAQCLALYAWTDLINLPRLLISGLAGLRVDSITSVREFAALDPGNPLFYYTGPVDDLSKLTFTLLTAASLFTLIHVVYFALGVSALTGMKKSRAIPLIAAPMLIVVAFKIAKAAIFPG
jgi:hypothetical protein